MKKYNFSCDAEFSDKNKDGTFTGILVKYNNERLAHGIFKFAEDSLKCNDGKQLFMLYQHDDSMVPVGTMHGTSDAEGFKIIGEFDLSKDDKGDFINQEAAKIYSLMKNKGCKFQLSVGGYITRREEISENNESYYLIKEFDAYEGSIVMRAAVDGSQVDEVFKNNDDKEEIMDKEAMKALLLEMFGELKKDMLTANTKEEITALKDKFTEFENKFAESDSATKKEFEAKFNEINEVLKTLKGNFKKENPAEFGVMEELYSIFTEVANTGAKADFKDGDVLRLSDVTKKSLKFSATTTGVPDAIKPTYVQKILERLQKANPILKYVNFMSITDNSLKISREELGLPTVGIVGETDARTETTTVTLDNVTIELFQWYMMPVVSNKLLATNYVGYLPFLIKRAEYALALYMANKLLNGAGTTEPLGILQNTAVTNIKQFDLTASTGAHLTDSAFAKQIKAIYYGLRSEIAENSVWFMRRETWGYISSLQNEDKDFYITDLNTGNMRTLMTLPVEIVEDDDSGLYPIGTATNGQYVMLLGDVSGGVQGIQNNAMTISIEDKITSKGFTKYYMEKGVGMAVILPENFCKISKKV